MESVAMPYEVHRILTEHLLREDGQEDLCFGLWYPSKGRDRTSALVQEVLLPEHGERQVHGNASFTPQYFERVISCAMKAEAGIVFLHSHPANGWQDMSSDDIAAEKNHAAAVFAATNLPLLGMTLGLDEAWSARSWHRTGPRVYSRTWAKTVRVVGSALDVTFNDAIYPSPKLGAELLRTISSWGPQIQGRIARLRVGIVGAGSVGSLVAESIARMGVSQVRLFDFDFVKPHNRDRLLHASPLSAQRLRPKVINLAEALKLSSTASEFTVEPLMYSIVEDEGLRAALDCDILFSCVDRPWPRYVLNYIAYAHLIPVIDGGILAETNKDNSGLKRADWRAHIVGPSKKCLECLGQYSPALVSAEREGFLDDPVYIQGLPRDHAFKRNENVFAFGMSTAAMEILQFLSMVVSPAGISNTGAQHYHFVTGHLDRDFEGCSSHCVFASFLARGDSAKLPVTGAQPLAEAARKDWAERNAAGMWARVLGWFGL